LTSIQNHCYCTNCQNAKDTTNGSGNWSKNIFLETIAGQQRNSFLEMKIQAFLEQRPLK
jgi:hypothetical protein